MSIQEQFSSYVAYMEENEDLRESVKETVKSIEQTARVILTNLQGIHQRDGIKNIPTLCADSRKTFLQVQSQINELKAKVKGEHYYRFSDHWRFVMQRLSFLAALLVYLETEKLATKEDVAHILGVSADRSEGFHLDLEDYLSALLNLATELARFAVNSVTAGDYDRPLRISNFVSELNAGFRLLNLKNDGLRKRFDALKYDVKKIEEIVYDLSIRGLINSEQTTNQEMTPV